MSAKLSSLPTAAAQTASVPIDPGQDQGITAAVSSGVGLNPNLLREVLSEFDFNAS